MGRVDEMYRAKLAQVNSMMKSHMSRVGVSSSNFSSVLKETMSNNDTTASKATSFSAKYGINVSTKPGKLTALPNENKYNDLIAKAADKYNLDPNLIKSVMRLESQFKRNALSSSGAMGLMQLKEAAASDLGITDPYDPAQNIDGGARYLRRGIDRFGDVRLSLAGYYTGPNRVSGFNIGDPDDETEYNKLPENVRSYIDRVINNYIQYTSD
ncbi:MAG: lytic transglycosylase domain-containing protein [Clostridiales bacterium]|nr:lytic transglycosylase domain-containing protein [Clostridiales bacterium]